MCNNLSASANAIKKYIQQRDKKPFIAKQLPA